MLLLILGLVIFLGVHSVSIFALSWRDAQARRNEKAWKGIYSLLSLVGLVLIVYGFGMARQSPVVLWVPPRGMNHLALLLMLPVFPLFIAPYFPGRIKTTLKHPQLVAVKLWAVAHLLANGNLHDVVLFGAFLAWAVVDRISVKRRPLRPVPGAPASPANDVIVVVLGLAIYAAFVWRVHVWLIGVSPLG